MQTTKINPSECEPCRIGRGNKVHLRLNGRWALCSTNKATVRVAGAADSATCDKCREAAGLPVGWANQ